MALLIVGVIAVGSVAILAFAARRVGLRWMIACALAGTFFCMAVGADGHLDTWKGQLNHWADQESRQAGSDGGR